MILPTCLWSNGRELCPTTAWIGLGRTGLDLGIPWIGLFCTGLDMVFGRTMSNLVLTWALVLIVSSHVGSRHIDSGCKLLLKLHYVSPLSRHIFI